MNQPILISDHYHYSFSAQHAPVSKVACGQELIFKTLDCFSNKITCERDLTTHFDYDSANPATGPVYVEGCQPGDILVVDILDIRVNRQGVVTTLPGCGPLADTQEIRTKVLTIEDGHALFNDLPIPIQPMVGVLGVAPAEGSVKCGFPGNHGGNMDCKLITKGARLYFPVQVAGALFALGDLHAVMGDGELCGTGLEIAGEVSVRFDVIHQQPLSWPVLETDDRWYAIACAQTYPEALKFASEQIQQLICQRYEWDLTDGYLYLSLQGDVEICQACKPCPVDLIVRVGVPKRVGCPLISKGV